MIQCVLLRENSKLPEKGSLEAAGFDLSYCPNNDNMEEIILSPRKRIMLPTGISMAIPSGYYGRIAPRSGMALKNGIDVLAGVIDADWRGEIQVILYNTSDTDFKILPGNRIAQIIIEKVDPFELVVVDSLSSTQRDGKGFGSSGI